MGAVTSEGVKKYVILCLIVASAVFWVFMSTADADQLDYINRGEQKLYAENIEDILDAHSIFEEAAGLYPNDPVIHGYLAFTRLLYYAFTYDSIGVTPLLNRYGITRTGIDTDTVKYELPRNIDDKLDIPQTAPNSETIRSYLHNQLLSAVNASLYNINITLSQWTTASKHIAYKENTGRDMHLEIDYGDAVLLSSLLKALKAVLLVISAYDLDVDVREVAALDNLEAFEFGKLIERYLSLLKLLPQESSPSVDGVLLLSQASTSLGDAIDDYIDASDAIRNDPGLESDSEELAEIDECDERVEEWMRKYLTEIKDSLDNPTNPDVLISRNEEEWRFTDDPPSGTLEFYVSRLESNHSEAEFDTIFGSDDIGWGGKVVCIRIIDDDNIYLKLESPWGFAETEFSGVFNTGRTQITGSYVGWNINDSFSGNFTAVQTNMKVESELVNPNPFFGNGSGPFDFRDFLPDFDQCYDAIPGTVGYGFDQLYPDATLGGILPEYTQADWNIESEVCTLTGTYVNGNLSVPFYNGQGIIFIQAFLYDGFLNTSPENRIGLQTIYANEFTEGMSHVNDNLPVATSFFVTAWWDANSNGILDPGELEFISDVFTSGPAVQDIVLGSLADTDTDGMPDDWERLYFGDLSRNGSSDAEYDGVNDLDEYLNLTIPINPDTDRDGFDDGVELAAGTDPTESASAPEQMVDGFYAEAIDPAKWQRYEFIRRINDGKLESAIARYDSTGSNNLYFKNQDDITSFQADVSVLDISEDDFNPKARLLASFFNNGPPGQGQTGDVMIEFSIRDTDNDSSNGLGGYYWIGRCENADCTEMDIPVYEAPQDWYPVFPGYPVTMKLTWNSGDNTFTLDFGGQSLTVASPFTNTGPASDPFKLIGTRISNIVNGQSGYVHATFDNVYRNEKPYDSFDGPKIDNTNWTPWELVRRVNNGVLESAVARYDTNGDIHLTFDSPHTITGYQADVTVTNVENSGAWPYARLAGAFYNDGTPGLEWTGDIIAQVGIAYNDPELVSFYSVARCRDDCNLQGNWESLIYVEDFVPVQLGQTYRLSLDWDESAHLFTFIFDNFTADYDPRSHPTWPAPMATGPRLEFNGIGTRVSDIGILGEWGYIEAKFDNVVVLSQVEEVDSDGDGFRDPIDNCPNDYNPDQDDTDNDYTGDICDNCPNDPNPGQEDSDGDGIGDVCENLGSGSACYVDAECILENCVNAVTAEWYPNPAGACCPAGEFWSVNQCVACTESDGDEVCDSLDNCPGDPNPDQADSDGDGIGDVCDSGDCPAGYLSRPTYEEDCQDRPAGSVCVAYTDGYIWLVYSPITGWGEDGNVQIAYTNSIEYRHVSDSSCIQLVGADSDNDIVPDLYDNCPAAANPLQEDSDEDSIGDVCDPGDDTDGDGVNDDIDNCPAASNADQADFDGDLIGDVCDSDDDNDFVSDLTDNCPLVNNPFQADFDGDSMGNVCDSDADGDGCVFWEYYDAAVDSCWDCEDLNPAVTGGECLGGAEEPKKDKKPADSDNDGVADTTDNCPSVANDGQDDSDDDNIGDACDSCPNDPENDTDNDGLCADVDSCPNAHNPPTTWTDINGNIHNNEQPDFDGDGSGDACDADADDDGAVSAEDCNDLDPGVNPDASEVSDGIDNNCDGLIDEGLSAYHIEFNMAGYDSWLPEAGQSVQMVVSVKDSATDETVAADAPGVSFTVSDVSNHPGAYTNHPDSDNGADLQITNVNENADGTYTLTVACADYGGSISIHAQASVTVNGALYIAQGDRKLPKDIDNDGVADAWEQQLYGNLSTLSSESADYDGDGLTVLEEFRGFKWGPPMGTVQPALNNAYGTHGTTAYVPAGDAAHFRTDPSAYQDLFIKVTGYDFNAGNADNGYSAECDCPFALGSAFADAAVAVHAVSLDHSPAFTSADVPAGDSCNGDIECWELNIDTVKITNNNTNPYGTSDGHINKRGLRDWSWDIKGFSLIGSQASYGSGTTTYQVPLDYYFSDRPYIDDPAIGGDPALLDPIDSNWCEDKNDNAQDDKVKGKYESQVQPDTSVLSGDMLGLPLSFENWHTALDVDRDGLVELPIANDPSSPAADAYANEYTKAQVLKHTLTHELGHAVGMAHTAVSACVMYEYTINWGRDGFFSDSARAAMRIHNQ